MSNQPLPPDQPFMDRALALAESALAQDSPNPQVGCVLVRDGKIIGEGAHFFAARDHAEIVAMQQAAAAGIDPCGATAYVTLEPCSHHGRTGPCADALIAAGIARCVVATADPNPAVSGRGLAKLRAAGIEVVLGPGQQRAREINNAFAFSIQHRRPFVTLKAALSADGFLAPAAHTRLPNQPHWLTGPAARAEVQRLRHASDAILTGIGTVLADNPSLTDRTGLPRRRPLMRIVLDSELRIPLDSTLVESAINAGQPDLWIFTSSRAPQAKVRQLEASGVRVSVLAARSELPALDLELDLGEVLRQLNEADLISVLLEAGSRLNGAFLESDLIDRAVLFWSEHTLGPEAIPFAPGPHRAATLELRMPNRVERRFGNDRCVSGLLHDPWKSLHL